MKHRLFLLVFLVFSAFSQMFSQGFSFGTMDVFELSLGKERYRSFTLGITVGGGVSTAKILENSDNDFHYRVALTYEGGLHAGLYFGERKGFGLAMDLLYTYRVYNIAEKFIPDLGVPNTSWVQNIGTRMELVSGRIPVYLDFFVNEETKFQLGFFADKVIQSEVQTSIVDSLYFLDNMGEEMVEILESETTSDFLNTDDYPLGNNGPLSDFNYGFMGGFGADYGHAKLGFRGYYGIANVINEAYFQDAAAPLYQININEISVFVYLAFKL